MSYADIMWLKKAEFENKEVLNWLFLSQREKVQGYVYKGETKVQGEKCSN